MNENFLTCIMLIVAAVCLAKTSQRFQATNTRPWLRWRERRANPLTRRNGFGLTTKKRNVKTMENANEAHQILIRATQQHDGHFKFCGIYCKLHR